MPGHRGAQRHTGVEQRQRRGTDRAHRGGAVGAQRLGHLTDRVRELLARRQHRHQGPLGECTVTDLAPLRRADPAGLTGRVGREVVVVHVALGLLRRQGVELLLQTQHVQRGDAQDLGLAALEQRRAVHPRHHGDLGGEGPDVGQPAAVDAHLLGEDLLPDELLGQRPVGAADLLLATLEAVRELGLDLLLERLGGLLTGLLVGDGHHLGEPLGGHVGDGGVHVVLVVQEDRELLGGLREARGQLGLRVAEGFDEAAWRPPDRRPRPPRWGRSCPRRPGAQVSSVDSASTIMIATSPSAREPARRPPCRRWSWPAGRRRGSRPTGHRSGRRGHRRPGR